MIIQSLEVPKEEFESKSGWQLNPEGACMGERCVPLPHDPVVSNSVDVRLVCGALGMPIVHEAPHGLYAVGPASGSSLLAGGGCPEIELPNLLGAPFNLAALRGRKVVIVAWASW